MSYVQIKCDDMLSFYKDAIFCGVSELSQKDLLLCWFHKAVPN